MESGFFVCTHLSVGLFAGLLAATVPLAEGLLLVVSLVRSLGVFFSLAPNE